MVDQEGVVYRLVHDIAEEDFNVEKGGQVEIIGWLYQYYNTEPKNAAFAKKSKITQDEIPAVTQLFTPDWIVRYMVENSLGRLWVEGHPDGGLKAAWKYYLEEAPQEPEVEAQLAGIRKGYAGLRPEDIRIIDPCMGSGHILVYAFDVLMQIYESAGYSQRDAAQSILEHNLYGLDIDDRAAQLAYFAVMMKARQYDRRILTRGIQPHVYAIQSSKPMPAESWGYLGEEEPIARRLWNAFADAKEYGSLINPGVTPEELDRLKARLADADEAASYGSLVTVSLVSTALEVLWPLIHTAEILARKYDAVITNPPYMGSANMDPKLSDFVKKHYPDSKSDLFAVFIERCGQLTKPNGYQAMITQHAWMFLSSFEKLRENLLLKDTVNMAHLGPRAFEEIGGEVVQTTSFVLCNRHIANYKGTYCRLIEPTTQQGKENMFLSGENRYTAQQSNFSKIPGSPVAYWVSERKYKTFEVASILSKFGKAQKGLDTCDVETFVRCWFEVSYLKIGFHISSNNYTYIHKWFPYSKGGEFRKWYGNNIDVVLWESNGKILRNLKDSSGKLKSRPQNTDAYFKEMITWSAISSSKPSMRYLNHSIYGGGGTAFIPVANLKYCLGFLNSNLASNYLQIISPTLNYEAGHIMKLPLILSRNMSKTVKEIVDKNIKHSKDDWDSYEISWDFKKHPLV